MNIQAIKTQLAMCLDVAKDLGYEGEDSEYNYTSQDLDAIVEHLGAKPTREEWKQAGLKYVGSNHCSESCEVEVCVSFETPDAEQFAEYLRSQFAKHTHYDVTAVRVTNETSTQVYCHNSTIQREVRAFVQDSWDNFCNA